MLVVRPISRSDYDALHLCAVESGHGFTSLPVDKELLNRRITHSEDSFNKDDLSEPTNESYLMVGVDSDTGDIAGTTGIEAAVGWDVPFYSYHISTVIHHSERLNVHNKVKILTLGNDYTGYSEVCTLFLRPNHRKGTNGRLMSKCRFLLMAEHPERFSKTVFAEMRGVSDEEGNSPFWKWLQTHFFSIDFTMADYLTGVGKKGFIADLMPKFPIYVNLLSQEAQAVIQQVHPQTAPALKLLQQEGFRCRDHIDIFDGGPTVECDLDSVKAVKCSFNAITQISEHTSSTQFLISNTRFKHFRAAVSQVAYDEETKHAIITPDTAKALQVEEGDKLRLLPMNI
ncbi:arginine N-succinyltransferase [Vibrio sp.]|nr:arginine N-succinyltransferase [Vibrio sp.]